jgi:hypothetical protein
VIAMRAPSGHWIGFRFGLTFMLPPRTVEICYFMPQFCGLSNCARKCTAMFYALSVNGLLIQ